MAANNPPRRRWALVLGLLTVAAHALAQAPAELLSQMRQQYPGEQAVYLDMRQDLTLEVRGDSVQMLSRHHYDILHLADQSAGYAMDQVYSSHFDRLQTVEARSLVPDGRSFKTIKVKEFKDKFDIRPGVFYDDVRQVTFTFPAVAPGVRTVTDYTMRFPDVRFLQPFSFGSYIPIRHAELTITAPRAARLNYKAFHIPAGLVQFSKQEKGGNVIYRWTADNLPSLPREDEAPETGYFRPHLVYYVEEIPVKGQPRRMLAGVDELYALYTGFVANADAEPTPALRHLVDSLVTGATTPDERARRIYHWVQEHVRYIAFEDGLRGFVPSVANKVYADRYGDCKDMANLTRQMLKQAGLPAYLAWIGTRDLPYRYEEVATPGVNNHMIAAYESKPGEYVFLDATSRHNPYGLPSSMIQGKEALVALDGKKCRVVPIPMVAREQNRVDDFSSISLDGTGLRGSGKRSTVGFARVGESYALDGNDHTQETRYVQRLLARGSNKFFVDTYDVQGLTEADQPLTIDYTYRLQDYVQQLDDEVYVNLNLNQPFANDRIDLARRKLPRENDFARTYHYRTELQVPANYDVTYLPPAMESQDSLAGFKIRYVKEAGKVVQEKDVYINYLLLQPAEFARWNAVVDKLTAAYRETIVLKRKKN